VARATETPSAATGWPARCRAHGLAITAPRQAILGALSRAEAPLDAVAVLQAARLEHAGTSLGTTYRFLRELELHGLARAQPQPHGRMRWHLVDTPPDTHDGLRPLLQQLRHVLQKLEMFVDGDGAAGTTSRRVPT